MKRYFALYFQQMHNHNAEHYTWNDAQNIHVKWKSEPQAIVEHIILGLWTVTFKYSWWTRYFFIKNTRCRFWFYYSQHLTFYFDSIVLSFCSLRNVPTSTKMTWCVLNYDFVLFSVRNELYYSFTWINSVKIINKWSTITESFCSMWKKIIPQKKSRSIWEW